MNFIRFTAILVSRFLLDLQAASHNSLKLAENGDTSSTALDSEDGVRSAGTVIFADFNVVGSLGSSLSRGEHGSFGEVELDELNGTELAA